MSVWVPGTQTDTDSDARKRTTADAVGVETGLAPERFRAGAVAVVGGCGRAR